MFQESVPQLLPPTPSTHIYPHLPDNSHNHQPHPTKDHEEAPTVEARFFLALQVPRRPRGIPQARHPGRLQPCFPPPQQAKDTKALSPRGASTRRELPQRRESVVQVVSAADVEEEEELGTEKGAR